MGECSSRMRKREPEEAEETDESDEAEEMEIILGFVGFLGFLGFLLKEFHRPQYFLKLRLHGMLIKRSAVLWAAVGTQVTCMCVGNGRITAGALLCGVDDLLINISCPGITESLFLECVVPKGYWRTTCGCGARITGSHIEAGFQEGAFLCCGGVGESSPFDLIIILRRWGSVFSQRPAVRILDGKSLLGTGVCLIGLVIPAY
jgi:hypothetical protein